MRCNYVQSLIEYNHNLYQVESLLSLFFFNPNTWLDGALAKIVEMSQIPQMLAILD